MFKHLRNDRPVIPRLAAATCLTVLLGAVVAVAQAPSANLRVQRLQIELEEALAQGNQAEVEEIRTLLRDLEGRPDHPGAGAAIDAARRDQRIIDLLRGRDEVRVEAEHAPRWNVWLVHFHADDRPTAVASVNDEGRVLEVDLVGPRQAERRTPEAKLRPPPFFINCGGGEADEERPGRRSGNAIPQLPDQPFSAAGGYGHAGGERMQNWFSGIWGTDQRGLFSSARINPGTYRFQLPPGDYLVSLGFCETAVHVKGQRVFDVLMQEQVVSPALDPFSIAGNGQAFRLAFPATVRSGQELSIGFRHVAGRPPLINAIWVHPRRDPLPDAPASFRGVGTYGMNALFWEHPQQETVAGYLIERRAAGETTFAALFDKPVPVSRWLDDRAVVGRHYEYRIQSVDVAGRRSDFSPVLRLSPRAPAGSTLPFFHLEVPPPALAAMLENVTEDIEVDAVVTVDDRRYPVRIRLRGASTRHVAKKSYRLEFIGARPAGRPKVVYLKAEPHDPTLQQEKLSCDVFSAMGLPVSQAGFVNVTLNGRHAGVYLEMEPVRSPFKERAGLAPDGTLIRAATFQHLGRQPLGDLRGSDGSLTELAEFIRHLNRTDRGEFEAYIRAATDWDRVLGYLVASMITHRSEIEPNDYFFFRDSRTLRWSFVPWDHNNGNFGLRGPRDAPERPFIQLYGQALQTTGPSREYWYVLPSRVFHQPALRQEYLGRLAAAVRNLLLAGRIDELVDRNFAALEPEALLDPFRWQPGQDRPFLESGRNLKSFVAAHGRRLLEIIAEEQRRDEPSLIINEFHFTADAGWVELHNRGRERISLARHALGSIEDPRRSRYQFGSHDSIAPGEYKIVSLTAGDRRVPMFNAQGGSIALMVLGREATDDERDDVRLVDWYFHGHQNPRYSYGRTAEGFGFMTPSPGRANPPGTFAPPALLADGGVRRTGEGAATVTARLTGICPGAPTVSVRLHYHAGDRWREMDMTLEGDRATAALPEGTDTVSLRYYFVAVAENELRRYAPLTAPADTYRFDPRPGP
jgi:spore coat protein H